MSSGPEGGVPASSVPYRDVARGVGLRVGQLAAGQANKKTWYSEDQGRQRCSVTLGMPVLPQRCPSWLAEPKAVRIGIDLTGKSMFQWSWVMMVNDEERTF